MPKWIRKWRVPSNSNPDKEYVVSLGGDGSWGCSCPAWIYRRIECAHIQEAKWRLAQERARAA